MYCFRCGKKLPPRVVSCPGCDTPQKRRIRYRRRMILGLFIFLAGAISGSLFDTIFFKGGAWDHSFMNLINLPDSAKNASPSKSIPGVTDPKLPLSDNDLPSTLSGTSSGELANPFSSPGNESTSQQPSTSDVEEESLNSTESVMILDLPPGLASSTEANVDSSIEDNPPGWGTETEDIPTEQVKLGKLAYDSCQTMVEGKSNSYHGFISRDMTELAFASDKVSANGKKRYQCFVKKIGDEGNGESPFEWPGNIWTPEISKNGDLIVFSSDSRSPEHVFVYDRQTKKSRALTMGKSKNMMPAISPDGSLIAYVSNEKGNNDIWLIGIDGSNKIQITQSSEDDREPRWLPDGRGLVFTRIHERLKKSSIMQIMLDPMGEGKALVDDGGRNWLADVSPDGTTLAFVRSLATDGSKNTLFTHDLITKEEKQIKPLGGAECFRPVWAPDGSGFVFHANVNKSKNLYKALFKREIGD